MKTMANIFHPLFLACLWFVNVATDGVYSGQSIVLVGEYFDFLIKKNYSQPIREVIYRFERELLKKTVKIAEFKESKLHIESGQFENRLEDVNDGMGLRIKNSLFKDSGTYNAKITLENHEVYTEKFTVIFCGFHHNRKLWPRVIPFLFVIVLGIIVVYKTFSKKEEIKLSVQATDTTIPLSIKYPEPEQSVYIPKGTGTYSHLKPISLHESKQKHGCYLDGCESICEHHVNNGPVSETGEPEDKHGYHPEECELFCEHHENNEPVNETGEPEEEFQQCTIESNKITND
ncbi:uncharacterized protein [Pyxicephalus adspersus]|uniref:uncharacterized protein isoform X2 n=1 Tax=Pyxicephalus adspersus TaxID=30357 RepID=UPI003B594E23